MALEPVQRSKQEHSAAAASASFSLDPSASLEDFKVIGTATRRAFAIGVRAPAFIESEDRILAVLRKDELIGLSPEEGAWFFRATAPRERIEVQLAVEPPAPQDPSTVRVHLHPAPGAPKLRPGQTGWVELATRSRELLLVPSGAVLYSAQGPYVLVAGADNRTFVTRQLEIGSVSGGFAVILSGLQEGERIAVGSAFSLDAERRLEAERQLSAAVMP
jgi:multidrug efflux pump subunit AcrA (membrane-fusion protein)